MPQVAIAASSSCANIVSLFADAAQAAIASALSCSCEAFSSWTSSALASIENPRLVGSLNTVATGAALAVSLKMPRMLAANSGPLSRQSLRGPGALLVHSVGRRQRLLGRRDRRAGPPVPVTVEPAEPLLCSRAVPDPLPVPVLRPCCPLFPAEPLLPAATVARWAIPGGSGVSPLPTSPGIAEPWPAQPEPTECGQGDKTGAQHKDLLGGTGRRSVSESSCDGRARQSTRARTRGDQSAPTTGSNAHRPAVTNRMSRANRNCVQNRAPSKSGGVGSSSWAVPRAPAITIGTMIG